MLCQAQFAGSNRFFGDRLRAPHATTLATEAGHRYRSLECLRSRRPASRRSTSATCGPRRAEPGSRHTVPDILCQAHFAGLNRSFGDRLRAPHATSLAIEDGHRDRSLECLRSRRLARQRSMGGATCGPQHTEPDSGQGVRTGEVSLAQYVTTSRSSADSRHALPMSYRPCRDLQSRCTPTSGDSMPRRGRIGVRSFRLFAPWRAFERRTGGGSHALRS